MSSSTSSTMSRDTALRGLIGIVIGGFFFWLALRQTSWADVSQILAQMQMGWVAGAIAAYIIGMAVRVVRWRRLMWDMKPLPYRSVSLARVVGYAMHNLLPTRLGNYFGQTLPDSATTSPDQLGDVNCYRTSRIVHQKICL